MIKRLTFIFLAVMVLIGAFSASAFAADYEDDSTVVPYGVYEGLYYSSSNRTYCPFYPTLDIDYSRPLMVTLNGESYIVDWHVREKSGKVIYYCGNPIFDFPDEGDNGLPFFVYVESTWVQYIDFFALGSYPDNTFTLEINLGHRVIVDPVPGPDIDNMEGGASAHYGAITDMLGKVLQWFGDCISAFFVGSLSSLVPVFALAIAIPLVFFAIKLIRQFLR